VDAGVVSILEYRFGPHGYRWVNGGLCHCTGIDACGVVSY
jgi:hypothetical protein